MTSNRILLITHAPLAHALRECVRHVFPDWADSVLTLDVQAHASPEQTLAEAKALLGGDKSPLLVLCDLFGATPANVAQRLVEERPQSRLISGVNLPMVLRSVTYRHEPLDALVQRALDGAAQGIMQVGLAAPQQQTRVSSHDQQQNHHSQ